MSFEFRARPLREPFLILPRVIKFLDTELDVVSFIDSATVLVAVEILQCEIRSGIKGENDRPQ